MKKLPWHVKSKTIIGALLLFASGLYLLSEGKETEGISLIGLALGIVGIRDKLQRISKK